MKSIVGRGVIALALFAGALGSETIFETPASASVSIAVSVEALVARSVAVVVATGLEERTAYEGGRIFTYSRARVDRPIAGDIGTGAEIWVRREGGIVDHVGMHVDGEPNVEVGKTSLLFLSTSVSPGTYSITARGQGQFPLVPDTAANPNAVADAQAGKQVPLRVHRNGSAGMLLPPKTAASEGAPTSSSVAASTTSPNVRLAAEALHDRPLDDVAQDIADTWKRVRAH